jgi:hypothetical protein
MMPVCGNVAGLKFDGGSVVLIEILEPFIATVAKPYKNDRNAKN